MPHLPTKRWDEHYAPVLTPARIAEFWSRIDVRGQDECWEWKAYRGTKKYGAFYGLVATRIVYGLTHGHLPNDLLMCHHCDNPPCCNPNHLFVGTTADNRADMVKKGRHRWSPEVRARMAKLRASGRWWKRKRSAA